MNILITGGAGSLGSILTKKYIDDGHIVRAYDINESGLADLKQKYGNNVRAIYGDISDCDRLKFAMRGVHTIIHTAAMKNITITESNVEQTIRTNINGTLNVAMSAIDSDVKKSIFISSDKAVESVLMYGDTKSIGEKIWRWAYSISKNTTFSTIRSGNFWKSNGNVFETWDKQNKDTGEITLTDPLMERYFIHTTGIAEFVMRVRNMMTGGEIYIPKMKLCSMRDLSDKYAREHKCIIKITGIRSNEKLIERLWSQHESNKVIDKGDFYVIK